MASSRGTGSPDDRDDDGGAPTHHPLDELFVVGAKYHEPSAAEREAAARQAEKDAKKRDKQRQKEIDQTRRVLKGSDEPRFGRSDHTQQAHYDKRVAVIGLGAMMALAVLLSFTPLVG